MLSTHFFTFNPFQENTYLIINDKKQCWIVDPGMYDSNETEQFNAFIAQNGLIPQAIINTHGHIDHIFGVKRLQEQYKIPFGIHEKEQPVLNSAVGAAMMFGFDFDKTPTPDFYIKEEEPLMLGDDELEVRFTPGHSPGSVVFYYAPGKWVIGGDVLFEGSIGRTDLPGGNTQTLLNSIRMQLFTLPGDTTVYPGHGGPTKVAYEKEYNPYIK